MRGKSEGRIGKVEALRDRPGTAGEQQAAKAALARINADVEPRQQQPLTDASVRRLPTPATGNRVYWDVGGVGGFGCRVTAAGSRAYVLDTGPLARPALRPGSYAARSTKAATPWATSKPTARRRPSAN
jgi:hypothetical protein